MFAGCGGMSTGLCLGAKACGIDLVTVLYQDSASKFHKFHPFRTCILIFLQMTSLHMTEMGCWHWRSSMWKLEAKPSRDTSWYLFVILIKLLCSIIIVFKCLPGQVRNESAEDFLDLLKKWNCFCKQYGRYEAKELRSKIDGQADDKLSKTNDKNSREYEVERLVDICYGDPTDTGKRELKFKVNFYHITFK